MESLLVYADGHTERRSDGGGTWWLHNDRVFYGYEVATDQSGEGRGIVVYVEKPMALYTALGGARLR